METRSLRLGPVTVDRHVALVLGLAAVVAVILVLRCFHAVRFPVLHNEDGTQMVAYYHNRPEPAGVLRSYEGYVAVLPNLLGYLAVRALPLHLAPYALVACSLGFAVAVLSLFSLRRFRCVMPDDRSRLVVCLLLALFPLGNHALATNLTFSIWNIFTLALLLVLAPLPTGRAARIVQAVFLALAVVSNPWCAILVPICLVLAFRRRTPADRAFNLGVAALAALYLAFGVDRAVAGRLLDPAAVAPAIGGIVQRVVFEPVFGNNLRMYLQEAGQAPIIDFFALVVVAVLGAAAVQAAGAPGLRNRKALAAFLPFVVVALTYVSMVGRLEKYGSLVAMGWGQRYFYTQQLLFVFVVAAYAVVLVGWRRLAAGARAALVVALVAYFGGLHLGHARYFATSKENGQATLAFLRDAEAQLARRERGEDVPRQMVLHRGGKWDIVLDLEARDRPGR